MKATLVFLLLPILVLAGSTRADRAQIEPQLTFTLETTEKTVQFLEPITIRVVLHNNSRSSISLNTNSLRMIADNWHVVGSTGAWSGSGEGKQLNAEGQASGHIDLPAGASLRLLHVHEDANVEQLGPVRVGFKLSSTDAATKRLLPTDSRYVSFDVPPTKLISAVWAAQTQNDRERTQPAFNEFLRFRAAAAAELEKDGGDFRQEMRNNTHAVKTLFYMAGYALPFLVDAAKDQDPFIREQSIPAYSYAARAITQLDTYLNELDALGPRPQWALTLRKNPMTTR